jgi:erythromycin esterase-like protein
MDTPQKPKRSRAMMDAQKRYYLKNRTAQLEKMKERARLRSAEQRELAMNDEKVLLERRAMMLDKYHTYMKNDKERRIKAWLDDPDISPAFKTFLIENVVPVKESIPRRFYKLLGTLNIAVKPIQEEPRDVIEHYGISDTADHYANSQAPGQETG